MQTHGWVFPPAPPPATPTPEPKPEPEKLKGDFAAVKPQESYLLPSTAFVHTIETVRIGSNDNQVESETDNDRLKYYPTQKPEPSSLEMSVSIPNAPVQAVAAEQFPPCRFEETWIQEVQTTLVH